MSGKTLKVVVLVPNDQMVLVTVEPSEHPGGKPLPAIMAQAREAVRSRGYKVLRSMAYKSLKFSAPNSWARVCQHGDLAFTEQLSIAA